MFLFAAVKTAWRARWARLVQATPPGFLDASGPILRRVRHGQRWVRQRLPLDPAGATLDQVMRGRSLTATVVAMARAHRTSTLKTKMRALVERLADDPGTQAGGSVALGMLLAGDGFRAAALEYFNRGGPQLSIEHAPAEYFDSRCAADRDAGLTGLETYLSRHRRDLPAPAMMDLLDVLARHNAIEMLRAEVREFPREDRDISRLSADAFRQFQWYQRLLFRNEPAPKSLPGVVNFAVMDYKLLDRRMTSRNRGDYVQTLAVLSNLLRFENVDFVGDSELASYLNGLRHEVHPSRRLSDVRSRVQPVPIDRDWASGREYPEDTWLICNGSFMHRPFMEEVDFPYPPNIKPLVLSFHIQDPDLLTDRVVRELRRIAPVGCRDWTTVYQLRDCAVPAFFSGCVTATIGQILPPPAPSMKRPLRVDARPRKLSLLSPMVDRFSHHDDRVRDSSLIEGIEDARQTLCRYGSRPKIVTSRLHCYLPARSMGLPVNFVPNTRSDIRLDGLLDTGQTAFDAMRRGLEDKLEAILRVILSGAREETVREKWSELCREDVLAAQRHASTYPPAPSSHLDVPAIVSDLHASRCEHVRHRHDEETVDIVMAVDKNLDFALPVVLQSTVENTERELHVHVLCRSLDIGFHERILHLFPRVNFTFYNCDRISYGNSLNLLAHTSLSTLDRLLMPSLLGNLNKVVYLDTDILVQGDVGHLYDIDLGATVCAGRWLISRDWSNMIHRLTRVTMDLPPEKAWEIRRRLHDTAKLRSRCVNAGVLVMNLALMREEGFTENYLHLVEQCRMNDQDVINLYSRDRITEFPVDWNFVPSQDFSRDPRIIHWAGPAKPWGSHHVLYRDRWLECRQRVQTRAESLTQEL